MRMESSRAVEILNRARERNAIVCLYPNAYSSKFAAGWVEAVSSQSVVIRSLTTNGRADGWQWRSFENIARLDVGGLYEERISFLAQMREARWKDGFLPPLEESADLKWELLVAAQKQDFAVHLDTGSDEPVEGFVQDVTPEWVTIDKVAFYGRFDGQSTIIGDDIEKILVDEQDLQDLQTMARRAGRGSGVWR